MGANPILLTKFESNGKIEEDISSDSLCSRTSAYTPKERMQTPQDNEMERARTLATSEILREDRQKYKLYGFKSHLAHHMGESA